MLESGYQKKIIKAIEDIGGVAINGQYTITGTADLICGYPKATKHYTEREKYDLVIAYGSAVLDDIDEPVLLHLHIEVKTEKDYHRVFRSIKEIDNRYVFNEDTKSLKKHEYLQIAKLNAIRDRGGFGLIAWNFEQVKEYMSRETA